jgi:phosphatidylserine/phosphatidylglycerophosphate/cardiolipin synthase-like enzyme
MLLLDPHSLADRGHADAHVRFAVDDHQAIRASPDHAVAAARLACFRHRAKDSNSIRQQRRGNRFSFMSFNLATVD